MEGLTWVNASQQNSMEYMGKGNEAGMVADYLLDTANFLYEQQSINEKPNKDDFLNAVVVSFIEEVLKRL